MHSNWENRPLRYSQEHYAGTEAFIISEIFTIMKKQAKESKISMRKFISQVNNASQNYGN
jgi:hypothetical protein